MKRYYTFKEAVEANKTHKMKLCGYEDVVMAVGAMAVFDSVPMHFAVGAFEIVYTKVTFTARVGSSGIWEYDLALHDTPDMLSYRGKKIRITIEEDFEGERWSLKT